MKKWMSIMLLIALALFGSVIGFNLFKQKMIANVHGQHAGARVYGHHPKVEARDWDPTNEAIGCIEPPQWLTVPRIHSYRKVDRVRED